VTTDVAEFEAFLKEASQATSPIAQRTHLRAGCGRVSRCFVTRLLEGWGFPNRSGWRSLLRRVRVASSVAGRRW
jgi:hypothetical protein